MGIFSGLFKSRDKPLNRTVGSSYTFFMGGSTTGKPVNKRSAMQMTAVFSLWVVTQLSTRSERNINHPLCG